MLFSRAHNNRFHDLPLLDLTVGRRFLHRSCDDVAEPGVQAGISSQREDAGDLARAGIIGHGQPCSHLHHNRAPLSRSCAHATRVER
jgi:hypothetical protein